MWFFRLFSAGQDHSQCNGAVSKSPSPNFRAANNMLSEYNTIERSPSTVQQVINLKCKYLSKYLLQAKNIKNVSGFKLHCNFNLKNK